MHNISTVIKFEIMRTLRKKMFWVVALGMPVMAGVIVGIIFFSNKTTEDAVTNLEKQSFTIQLTDKSGLISREYTDALNIARTDDKEAAVERVRSGKLDAYFYYPADLSKNKIEVYGKDAGLFKNGRYGSVAQTILTGSVGSQIPDRMRAVVDKKVQSSSTIYRDGAVYDGFMQMVWPGIFLVLFYFLIAFFGGQMLTSTTEEKENRVIEMLLTMVEAKVLILGKIISLVAMAILQSVIMLTPVVIGYLLFRSRLHLPSFDISSLPVDSARILVAACIFVASFMLFTGLLVAIGASVPTAKDAGNFLGMVMVLIFGPLYAASLFVSAPESPFVRVLTFFPFTAPIPLLLRNAVGNLQPWEAAVGIAILLLTAVLVIRLAVRLFRFGALEYSRKLSVREILSRH